MLRATVRKVDEKPRFYTVLLEDATPERGRPINTQVTLSAAGLDALRDAIASAQTAESGPTSPQIGKAFVVQEKMDKVPA